MFRILVVAIFLIQWSFAQKLAPVQLASTANSYVAPSSSLQYSLGAIASYKNTKINQADIGPIHYFAVANTITTSSLTNTNFCSGDSTSVSFTITGTFNSGNVFTAQLSDASGSFVSPTNIGTLTSTNSGSISATIPTNTAAGSAYRIRVISSDPVFTGSDNGGDVTINALPVAPTAGFASRCSTGTVALSASGCAGGTLNWFTAPTGGSSIATGSSYTTPSIASTTTYYVSCTDANTCVSARSSVIATVNPLPSAPSTTGASRCSTGTVALSASGCAGGTLDWFTAPTGGTSIATGSSYTTPSIVSTTTYYVSCTDANTCVSARSSVIATVNPLPSAPSTTGASRCSTGTVALSASGCTGGTLDWFTAPSGGTSIATGSSYTTPSIASTTTYYVSCTDANTCVSGRSSVIATVKPLPVANAGSDVYACSGDSYIIGSGSTAGTSYLWSPTSGLSSATVSNPFLLLTNFGTADVSYSYIVTATKNGCSKTDTLIVKVKPSHTANAGSDISVCSGSQNNIGSASALATTYLWSPTTGLSSSTVSNPKVQLSNFGLVDTTWRYVVSVTKNACIKRDTVLVKVKPLPVANAGVDKNVCSKDTVIVGTTALTGYTYSWSPSTFLNNATSAQPRFSRTLTNSTVTTNNYTVTSTFNGCTNKDIVVVKTYPNPDPVITGNNSVCLNSSNIYSVAALSNSTYTWYATNANITSGQGTRSATVIFNSLGSSQLVIERRNTIAGCVNFDTLYVLVNALPVSSIAGNTTVCAGTQLEPYTSFFNAGNTYTWSVTGGTIATGQNTNAIAINWFTTPGSRLITLTQRNVNGCSATATMGVLVNATPSPAITGQGTLCQYTRNQLYSVSSVAANTYLWTVTKGVIISGQNTNSIRVNWDSSGTGLVSVVQTNSSACSKTASKTITINPNTLPEIIGNNTFCNSDTGLFTVNAAGGNTYTWSVSGGSILSGQYSNSLLVKWTTAGAHKVIISQKNAIACSNTDTLNVTVNSLPTIALANQTVCEGSPATLTATGALNYSWNIGQLTSAITVTPSVSSNYTVYGTNANGCSSIKTASVTLLSKPLVTINNPSICVGSTATLTAAGAQSFSWNTGASSISINVTPTVTTNYTAIGTNSAGCKDTAISIVTVNALPLVIASADDTICKGESAAVSVSGNASSYSWNTGSTATSISVVPITTTSYTVTGTIGACTANDVVRVIVNPKPSPSIVGAASACQFASNVTYSVAAITGNTYVWSISGGNIISGQNTNSIKVNWLDPGSQTITVLQTNTSNCSTSASKTININSTPEPLISGNTTFCKNDTVLYSVSSILGNNYSWSVLNGVILSGQNTNSVVIKWTGSGTGRIIVTESNPSACLNKDTLYTTINTLPLLTSTSVTVCNGSSATLSATGAQNYIWSNAQTGASIVVTPSVTTSYTVSGTDVNGCIANAVSTVNVLSKPTVLAVNDTICVGDVATLSASGTNNYLWNTGNTGNSLSVAPLTTTVYTVIGTASNGCKDTAFADVIVNNYPTVNAGLDETACKNTPVMLIGSTNAINYSWSSGSASLTDIVTPAVTTHYIFTANSNGCISKDTTTVFINDAYTISNPQQVCAGSSYFINGNTYNVSGIYFDTLATVNGCDSIIVTNLVVNNVYAFTNPITICSGESYFINGNIYNTSGVYKDTLQSVSGCDSIITTLLTVNPVYSNNNPQIICQGDVYSFNGNNYTSTGNYNDTLVTANGCDSIIVTLLTVNPVYVITNPQIICQGATYNFNGNAYSISGTYNDTLASMNACDSIIITQLTVNPVYSVNNPQTICDGSSYSINGNVYTISGTYSDTLSSISGCDSIVSTQLVVNPVNTTSNPQVICSGEVYTFNGNIYNTSGIYKDTLQSVSGCDSIITTLLTVNPRYTINNPQVICQGNVYTFNGNNYTSTGNYNDTLVTANGCDSIIVTQLTVNPVYVVTNPQIICQGATYNFNGNAYSISGTYNDTLVSINGCDSIIITQLTVNPVYSVNNPQTICDGSSYTINGNVYTISGTYSDTLSSISGCDSIVSTQLLVNPVNTTSNPQVICSGEVYTFNGNIYNASGIYKDTLQSVSGCDSIITTLLTVNPGYSINNPQVICQGNVYSFNGNNYTTTGNYNDTLVTANGCDSIIVTQLTVNPVYVVTNPQIICQGAAYNLNGNAYSISGTYNDTLLSINGCDSIIVTQLTVSPLPQVNLTVTDANCLNAGGSVSTLITQGTPPYSYSWSNGQTTSLISNLGSGTYHISITDANGCLGNGTALVNTITPSSSIVGYVKLNGNPVTNGVVKVYRKKNQQAYPLYDVKQLDNNGFFRFDNLPNDTFIVGGAPNPASYPNTGTIYNGNGHKWELATVTITGCSSIDTLRISSFTPVTQKGNGKITGRIIDISDTSAQRRPGEPIKGAGVTLQKKPGGNPVLRVSSDSTGTYSMDSVAVGNYDLYVDVPGCGMFNSYVIPLTVTDNFFEERNFYVDSIEGFIDTIDYEIAFLPCNFIPVFNVMSYCAGDQITFQDNSIGTDTSLIYSWDFDNDGVIDLTNQGNATYSLANPGNYTASLELIDLVNGCSKKYLRSYEIKPLPVLQLDSQEVFCKGQTANLLVTGADNYLWESSPYLNGSTSDNPQLSTTGAFSQWFNVRGETNGCYSYDSIFVEVKNAPTLNFSSNPVSICQFNDVEFVNQTQALGFDPAYQWDFNGDGITDDTSLTIASYAFENFGNQFITLTGIFNNGCEVSKTIPVNVKENTIQVSAGFDRTIVCGDKVTIQAYSNTQDVNWEWSPNYFIDNNFVSNPILSPDTTVQYIVKSIKQGCYSLDTVQVNVIPLNVNVGIDKDLVCGNSTNILATSNGVGGTIYNWISGGNLNSQTSLNVIANPTESQTYVLMAVNNTCVAYDTVSIYVKPIPVNAGSDKTMICGQSATLSANTSGVSGVSYNWEPATFALTPGSANTVVKPEQSTYFVVKGMLGACVAFDTAYVKVDPFTVYAGQDQYLNCGDSKQLVASSYYSSGINVLWQPSSVFNLPSKLNPVVKSDSTVKAILQVTKDNCVSTDTVMIYIKNEIPISFNADKTIFASKFPPYTVKFTNTTPNLNELTFYWNFGDGTPLISAKNYTHTYNQSGNFDVSLIAMSQSGACGDTLGYNDYIITWTPTAIPNLLSEEGVNLFPNPNQGKFIIVIGNNILPLSIKITDVTGKLIEDLKTNFVSSYNKLEVDLSRYNLPKGSYMLKISTEEGEVVKKVVIN
jgi:hypothetical protein